MISKDSFSCSQNAVTHITEIENQEVEFHEAAYF